MLSYTKDKILCVLSIPTSYFFSHAAKILVDLLINYEVRGILRRNFIVTGNMTVKRLTATGINKIKPPETGRIDVTDSVMQGLNLRITATGVKSWCYAYRDGGKQVRMTLGRHPDLNLVQARKIVKSYKTDLTLGNNPVTLRQQKLFQAFFN